VPQAVDPWTPPTLDAVYAALDPDERAALGAAMRANLDAYAASYDVGAAVRVPDDPAQQAAFRKFFLDAARWLADHAILFAPPPA
jgi:hypothetical protein